MKSARHAMILEIIENEYVETQDELAAKLRDKGIAVTQATVSRDIKELRLIKVLSDDGVYKYATADKAEAGLRDRLMRIFSNSVVSITSTGFLIVIKTISGTANAAAETIDSIKWPEILGTLAGDNSIFVVVKDAKLVPEIIERFHQLIKH